MTPTKTITPSVPSVPIPNGTSDSYYTLFYRQGRNPHPMTKNFHHTGSIRDVVERAKKHCEVLGARFVRIEPLFSNLENDERTHMGVKDNNED